MEINLNIRGIKNYADEELGVLLEEIKKLEVDYNSLLYQPIRGLEGKIRIEIGRRERRNWVWVEFVSYWSGYTSRQRKIVGKHYRKVERTVADKLPSFYSHRFGDNTTNDWSIKIVSVRGKDEGSYSQQVDDILKGKEKA